ncbi:MAG TPA: GDP-mannose 4,6-dehydratase [Myxococcota bacterium]|nr:GDP-mannose 4,6-dehydratase [Myxococcota bacterium]
MRVLVTGAAGFVGRRLVPHLETLGCSVEGFDHELDVADADAVAERVAGARPEAIVHLAARSSVAESFAAQAEVYRVNYLGARAVLEAARARAPRARVLLVGSGEVYGPGAPGAPGFDESAPLRPGSPYARSKAAADLLGARFAAAGLDVVRVRPFPHTGPGQSDRFAASSFARQLAEAEAGRRPPRVRVGNLDAVRDYLDVDDVVEAYARLLDPRTAPGVYNVASGTGVALRAVLEALLRHARVQPELEVDPARLRPADSLVGDATRLARATGWAPRRPLDDTLARLLDDWRARITGPP